MSSLVLNNWYLRKEVYNFFRQPLPYPNGGPWHNAGIAPIKNAEEEKTGDYAFFVTYGASQGGHTFDEDISDDGVLTWQSQAQQGFSNEDIQTLINHDETKNSIYLFIRQIQKGPYEYFGRLKYLSHDKNKENPVYFKWQLIDIGTYEPSKKPQAEKKLGELKLSNKKPKSKEIKSPSGEFKARSSIDYIERESKKRDLGLIGEELVIKYETQYLKSINRSDLAEKIVHVSVIEGDGAGYDIKSFDEYGNEKFIEVKTTKEGINTDFFMSPNELRFAERHSNNYFIYRVYRLKNGDGQLFVLSGKDIMEEYNFTPTGFRLSKK